MAADDENPSSSTEADSSEGALADVAKVIGAAAGKVASLAGGRKKKEKSGDAPVAKPKPQLKENAYKAEYLGSGTFKISKPKRAKAKRRQSALKAPRRGARK